jgi:DNA-binding transcriptional MerR regulator
VTSNRDQLTVGQFARASGLTSKALRHYHELGVLAPARIDPDSGYRLYDRAQLELARQIRVLRELDVPLAEIAVIVGESDPDAATQRLMVHRRRVEARLTALQTKHYLLGKLIEQKEMHDTMPARPTMISLEPETQRKLAAELFNYTWTLLETEDRDTRLTDRMVAAAYASRFFWEEIGGPVEHARGAWQISRTCATAGRPEEALYHARRCLKLCEDNGIADFDLAYAYEGLARAHALAANHDDSRRYLDLARAAAGQIAEKDDRDLLESDLATIPE